MHEQDEIRDWSGLGIRLTSAIMMALLLIVAPVVAQEEAPSDGDSMTESMANDSGGMTMDKSSSRGHMGGMGGHGKGGGMGGHGKGGGKHGMMKGGQHGHGGHHGHDGGWKAGLTETQRQQMKALKVAHMKVALPLKMKMKAIKAELVALATADSVDQAALEAKIDDLLWHKRLKMIEKYRFMAAKRQLLTPEQRLEFDMAQLKRLKKDGHGGHGKH